MPRPRHAEIYEGMQEKIKAAAWELVAEVGAARLSMRELGRRMGMSAPALYNYYANQDDLLTTLVVDGYGGLATVMEKAHATVFDKTPYEQFEKVINAYYLWATTHPNQYDLIYGSPVKGYEAPRDLTVPQVVRLNAALDIILEQAYQANQLHPRDPYQEIPTDQKPIIKAIIAQNNYPVSELVVYLGLICLAELSGFMTYAIHGHLAPLTMDIQFQVKVTALSLDIGISP